MRDLKISYGNSCYALKWHNDTIRFDELCRKLGTTVRTTETAEEYSNFTREQRDAVKDRGGFVGGSLKGERRQRKNVECRSMLTEDVDQADEDFVERYVSTCSYESFLYATHSYTESKPRLRIVVPLTRDVTAEEYVALARYFAAEWGIDMFDECSYRPHQLMYWPTTSSDGEFLSKEIKGKWLDPDVILSAHPDWRDPSTLPVSSKERPLRKLSDKNQADPLEKEGVIGAFNRAFYPIDKAIEELLPGVYEPTADMSGRYDYIPGEGSAGVVVYEDKFAYSHHATDPAVGKLCSAFDLVRIHKFGDGENSLHNMMTFAQTLRAVQDQLSEDKAKEAADDFSDTENTVWKAPIPFSKYTMPDFPIEALPNDLGDFACAVAQSTQTPLDMAGSVALSILSICLQGKYVIQPKSDWKEPLNSYLLVIAAPSERKSAVLNVMLKPINDYEEEYNKIHAPGVEANKMQKRILERRQKAIEDQVSKGKADTDALMQIAQEIADFKEERPMQLYVDDITTEKLVSVLSANRGRAAIISSEGGIFDTLSGIYTRNVNIDVMLKGYSGDPIRVDRVGRESESINNPALSLFLMAQPRVIAEVLKNKTFRGRGLTARFLYCMPKSLVGSRKFASAPMSKSVYLRYEALVKNLLEDDYNDKIITISREARERLEEFSEEIEVKLTGEYAEIADWAGRLVGTTVRIAGLLCRAEVYISHDFLDAEEPLVVSGQVMENAIKIGEYYLKHAQSIYSVLPENDMYHQAEKIIAVLKERNIQEFDRREMMRICRNFKTVSDIQPVLDFLDDYGYIDLKREPAVYTGGRPPLPKYRVNPMIFNK